MDRIASDGDGIFNTCLITPYERNILQRPHLRKIKDKSNC